MNGLRQQFHHVAKPNVGKTGQIQIQKNKYKYKYIPRPDTNIKLQIQVQALAMQRIAAKPSVGKTD